jgi:hypothetical protein
LICMTALVPAMAGVKPAQAAPDSISYGVVEPQIAIARVDAMPDLPAPLKIRDWRKTAIDFTHLAFNLNASGQYLPLIWLDPPDAAVVTETFGIPSYVGANKGAPLPHSQEAVTCLPAVLSAALAGGFTPADARRWVPMCLPFYNTRDSVNSVENHINSGGAGSFWYDLWPAMIFDGIASNYPNIPGTSEVMRGTATSWQLATQKLTGADGIPDFNHTSFRLSTMTPVDNGRWQEPDGASGVSYLEYLAYARYGDAHFLVAADGCQKFLDARSSNPQYEVLESYGAYIAARMDAELGRNYDVDKQMNWLFDPGPTRPYWGVIVGNWNGCDCSGLIGSTMDAGGYGFAMNTFAAAGSLIPLTRYDQRFARAVGKWMLNAANAAGLFYPNALPPANQSCPNWSGDPAHCIAYEGLRKHPQGDDNGPSPFAGGDPIVFHWGAATDYGLYGSAHVGFFGGVISQTSDRAILRLDCLKTDFFHAAAYPTYLYYNPYASGRTFQVDVGQRATAIYSLTRHVFLTSRSRGKQRITLPPDTADVLVFTPANGVLRLTGTKLFVNGLAVDFRAGMVRGEITVQRNAGSSGVCRTMIVFNHLRKSYQLYVFFSKAINYGLIGHGD